MIALVPTAPDLDRLAIDEDGAELRDELHLTLYYLGKAADVEVEMRDQLEHAVRSMIENRAVGLINANAFGVAHWNPESDDPAWVLNVGDVPPDEREPDGESLGELRTTVTEAIHDGDVTFELPAQHTPWQPHICLAYSTDDYLEELSSRLGPVSFDRVRLAFGGDIRDVPLGRTATVAATSGGIIVPWSKTKNHSSCPAGKPWAVVKDSDGSVAGCHASESDADAQLAALYASEDDATLTEVEHFATGVSDAPWNGAASRFEDDEYRRAAAACDGEGTPKETCFLPHHEPDGTLSRSGVHAAAARLNQVDASSSAKAKARSHLRRHYSQLGEDVPDVLKAELDDVEALESGTTTTTNTIDVSQAATAAMRTTSTQALADTPRDDDDDDGCPDDHRQLPDGSCVPEDEYQAMAAWHGVLCVEGITTGDGREFAPEALSFADTMLLRWQKESAHGGQHDVTVSVGRIDRAYRVGNQIMGEGVLDLQSADGFEVYRRLKDGFAGGISIDADDISDADVEFVWADDPDGTDDDDPFKLLFGAPEKIVFHAGRVRAATLVDIPAFVEARIQLGAAPEEALAAGGAVTSRPATVVERHGTEVSDAAWDSDEFSRRLPNILDVGLARQAYAYVTEVKGSRVAKATCGYLHHEIHEDKTVGAANLTACASAIATLRVDDTLSDDERSMIYVHLAGHLRDGGQEPPPLNDEVLTAAITLDDWRPPRAWFENPQLSVPTGITVTDEGRVYGHAAQWGECHIGFSDQCVTLPREADHPYFMTGELRCADGERVAVGQITVGTGHAPLTYRASQAAEHYDNTGAAVADVAVGNDQFGLWVAGAIRASVAASRVHELRASGQVSGDWRRIGGQLRLVGLLAVNVPGFPVPRPRARVASGAPLALVAAGRTAVARDLVIPTIEAEPPAPEPTEEQLNQQALRRVMNLLRERVQPITEVSADV